MAFISVADEVAKKSLTTIKNKFITKYLPMLDSDAIKVYIFSVYIYQNSQSGYTICDLATKLQISEEQAINCFEYLDEMELVKITSTSPFEVKILDCENIYGTPKKLKPEKYADFAIEVQSIITGRMVSPNEYMEYYYLLEEYGFERNALLMIINYCVNMRGADIRSQYIIKVAKSFAEDEITSAKNVEEKLSNYTASTPALLKIFAACGINKKPDYDDDSFYQKWSKELGFDDQAIIAASKFFKIKSTERLDNALCELYKNRKFDVKEIEDYCKTKNSVYAAAKDIAKLLGVYMQDASPYVENYINVWIGFGFELDTLKLIANYCFLNGKNSFEKMNDFILSLYDEGIITTADVDNKIDQLAGEDKLIKNLLSACGLTRKIIPMDRECLKRWKSWNFSNEMLFAAAETSLGKNNPVAYMNTVLSSWKSKGIFTKEQIPANPQSDGKANRKSAKQAQRDKENAIYKEIYDELKAEEEKDD
jgi:DNA replication protein DnaD